MAATVRVTTDNKISVVELPDWSLSSLKKAIDADCTEIVSTQIMYDFFGETIVMIVDESGYVKGKEINMIASFLYGIQNHGMPITGDVIFGFQKGADTLELPNTERVKLLIEDNFEFI